MLFRAASTVAILALAGQAVAEAAKKPYKPELAKMSLRSMLGRRQEDGGYQPDTTFCGTGATCAEACGAGFEQCASTDSQIHCFNVGTSQTCCPNGSGDSCDAGYYCSADSAGATWCCPNGLSTADCAAQFGVTGGLSSQVPASTSSSVAATSSSAAAVTSSASEAVSTSNAAVATENGSATGTTTTTSTEECTTYTSQVVQTVIPTPVGTTNSTGVAKSTGSVPTASSPVSTTPVQAGASTLRGSMGAAVVLAGLGFAALL
ncbi:uncharacterized protein JN550_002283 [Neoarthrinium moseri]|uniref:uncharacterized protein n=1 Tax=Neoarthrinium moseri TaxID=1658444 RepID=UPI001FDB1251|nr:uncharacterized protein JN550_002283 [Neoarthrinium moseri]KAI1874854.1 hypothetical protein JN550_002283 [Neoarthrinium moseri]